MIKGMAVKASLCAAAIALSLSYAGTAKAATSTSDIGIAGITPVLDNYYTATAESKTGDAEKLLESLAEQETTTAKKLSTSEVTKVESPYANLGISIATDWVNIRSKPNTDSDIVGKLYQGCATDILETEGDWVKIHSGNVDGYIKAEYLAIGEDAEKLIDKYASKYATVNTETLFVRAGKSTDAEVITMIPQGEKYYIIKEYDEWAKILIDEDESGNKETGYVSKDYIDISVEFEYAISIEEEQAKIAAEEAAKQAEAERLEALAKEQEEQRQQEAESKQAAESKAEQSEQTRNNTSSSDNSSSNSSSSSDNSSSSGNSSGSSKGVDIANYALNFVGNPYVWGGTSLTNGTDCSGFTQSIYAHFGYSIPRTSGSQAQSAGRQVSMSELQAGDLIFYCNSSGSVGHVALYIGNGKVVHASNERDGIKISNYNYRTPYIARRVIN